MKSCKGCKHYKKDEKTRLIICEFDLHESYCEKDKEDFAIAELEKIKADIEEDKKMYSYDEYIQKGHSNCIEIVNSHISELKGEDKSKNE